MSAESKIHAENDSDSVSAGNNENEEMSKNKNGVKAPKEENKEMKELHGQLEELNDKYLRLYSDFENFRKRANKEKIELIQHGNRDLLLNILPVVDDFERAIEALEKTQEEANAINGVMLIYNKLKTTLQQSGLKEIEAKGMGFDPEIHEALTTIPAPADELKGKVVDVVQKGYSLHDKVIRHAKVVVGE